MSARPPEQRCACVCEFPCEATGEHRYHKSSGGSWEDPKGKPAPEPGGRMSDEEFERLIEHDRYESMMRLNECKLIVEARRARASEDALRHTLDGVTIYLLGPGLFTEEQVFKAAAALKGEKP